MRQRLAFLLILGLPVLGWLVPMMDNMAEVAFAQNRHSVAAFYRCSHDEAILRAFRKISDSDLSEANATLDKIVERPIRVIFKDLGQINKAVRDFDALSWLGPQGQLVIYINQKHQGAPPEALAAIISHEALHDDPYNSLPEEVAGWTREATVWQAMKYGNPALAKIPAGAYPLVDRLNRIESEYGQGSLETFVRSNPGYAGLPERSPGFSAATASLAP